MVASPDKTPPEYEPPKVADEWAVVDRWWTDEPEHRVYAVIRIEDEEIVVRYDRKTRTFELQEPRG